MLDQNQGPKSVWGLVGKIPLPPESQGAGQVHRYRSGGTEKDSGLETEGTDPRGLIPREKPGKKSKRENRAATRPGKGTPPVSLLGEA